MMLNQFLEEVRQGIIPNKFPSVPRHAVANHVVMSKEKPLMTAMKEVGDWKGFEPAIYRSLIEQLNTKKEQTWREKMDKEFGL